MTSLTLTTVLMCLLPFPALRRHRCSVGSGDILLAAADDEEAGLVADGCSDEVVAVAPFLPRLVLRGLECGFVRPLSMGSTKISRIPVKFLRVEQRLTFLHSQKDGSRASRLLKQLCQTCQELYTTRTQKLKFIFIHWLLVVTRTRIRRDIESCLPHHYPGVPSPVRLSD